MKISKIDLIRIDDELLIKCDSFQENFRNSNGNLRRKSTIRFDKDRQSYRTYHR